MSVIERIARGAGVGAAWNPDTYTLDELPFLFEQAVTGGHLLFQQTLSGDRVAIAPDFLGHVRGALKANPIVFTCALNRAQVFSQGRFQFKRRSTGDIFGTEALGLVEHPLPGKRESYLLTLAELWNSAAGNFFAVARRDGLRPLRPDWVGIVLGTSNPDVAPANVVAGDVDVDVVGYRYWPDGPSNAARYEDFLPEEMAHYMPIPDPEAPWRGMSWLSAILDEVAADQETTEHKRKFLERGGTPNLAVITPAKNPKEFDEWVEKFRAGREGRYGNPYMTLFLAGGADAKVIGSDLAQLDFRNVQGGGEVRICAAAGVPAAIAQISDGLSGSTLNTGNFEAAWRILADQTIRPLWNEFAGALENLIATPEGCELIVDVSGVAAMKEGAQAQADIQQKQATTISTLITAGFEPASVVDAVARNDMRRLTHTGLTSVQLLPPGEGAMNGNGNGKQAALAP